MVHLAALPGAPSYCGDLDAVIRSALEDAAALAEAGFDGLMVENFGDAPFFADDVPKITVAAMTRVVAELRTAVDLPVGVNLLRNDALGALAVAAATGAGFVRVNVLSGTMFTDQGPIVGRAAAVARTRAALAPEVAVMADVFVKHATPPPGLSLAAATRDLVERAGADVVVVSGAATGDTPPTGDLETVAEAAAGCPVYVGSGATSHNVAELLTTATGVIVGTALKAGGTTTNPIDPGRAAAFVAAASPALHLA
jgi:membrane complex biogenesis BtpA family protein